jgi:signal transduction histidine kinase/ActR/RegA family two-component response regulator
VRKRRPIRDKLLLGGLLVGILVATLSASSFLGIYSYRRLVRALSCRAAELPLASELDDCVGDLRLAHARALAGDLKEFHGVGVASRFDAIRGPTGRRLGGRRVAGGSFADQVEKTSWALDRYCVELAADELDDMPFGDRSRERETARDIAACLETIRSIAEPRGAAFLEPADDSVPDQRRKLLEIEPHLERLAALCAELPTFLQERLHDLSHEVRIGYRTLIVTTWASALAAAVLLATLGVLTYRWVFRPLRLLGHGSRRVAKGDFGFRIRLDTRDEMAELAAALNDMTQRFEEIRDDLDRQVQLRTREVIRNEQLASVGFLAAGVAHEINNPLTYIVGNLSVIEELVGAPDGPEPADLPDLRAATREALQGVQKVANITKSLLSLARSDTGTLGPVEMGAVIEACVRVAANEIRHRARLELQLQPVPTLWANEGELSQVVLNLLLNAAHAIPSGHAAQNTITVRCKVDGGDVLVQVEDTGAGIPERILGRIFEPFFTTKDVGTGTGLGLAVSRRLIQDLGGTIQVHSELGRGTCFDVRLPVPEALGRSLTPPTVQQAPRMRVLVVDDDPLVARALERMLAGHEVMLAVGGQDALAQLEGGLHPDAILSDLMMPEMTGLQLHAAVEALWPELGGRFVLVTGGAFGGDIAEALARADLPQITKPVDRVELAALLASLAPRRAP